MFLLFFCKVRRGLLNSCLVLLKRMELVRNFSSTLNAEYQYHVIGTSLGDLIEIQGINEVFESSHGPDKPLVVGAAKSCVGHAELVAGLIGVVKTLGSFAEGSVPGLVQLTSDNMNPKLDCSVVPLHIPVRPSL
ncbi:hypothetical protein BDZ97DRAFT_803902 [Flammula alnicola]|nr:hypothetical protein BDZ97DRAFT_803902 [Flammula alnicola]